jgi:hypothetical protein
MEKKMKIAITLPAFMSPLVLASALGGYPLLLKRLNDTQVGAFTSGGFPFSLTS